MFWRWIIRCNYGDKALDCIVIFIYTTESNPDFTDAAVRYVVVDFNIHQRIIV